MSWLELVDNKVVLKPEGEALPEVKKIRKSLDFDNIITWVFHVYKPEHALEDLLPDERKQRVCDLYFKGEDVKYLDDSKNVQAFIKVYLKDSMTAKERFHHSVLRDIADMLEHLQSIELFHIIKKEVEVVVEIPDGEGNMKDYKAKAKLPIRVDNSKEKMEVIKRGRELLKMEGDIKMDIKKERQRKKQKGHMFDKQVEIQNK